VGTMNKLFGGIEGGGTKFICAVGTSPMISVAKHAFQRQHPMKRWDRQSRSSKKRNGIWADSPLWASRRSVHSTRILFRRHSGAFSQPPNPAGRTPTSSARFVPPLTFPLA
jgi:hypothetical protein